MSFKDYFNMGRENERNYQRKQQARKVVHVLRKPSPYSFAGLIMGAGALYEIIHPFLTSANKTAAPPAKKVAAKYIFPIFAVIKYDIKRVINRVLKDRKWEEYQRFEDIVRGKK